MQFIGRRIAECRKVRGVSQSRLAAELDISRASVSAWEKGQASPTLDKIEAIASLLGVEPGWLAFGPGGDDVAELLRSMTPRQRAAWIEVGKSMIAASDDDPAVSG